MSEEKDGWIVVASIDDVRAEHPDWSEDQCRAEFDRKGFEAIMRHVKEMDVKKRRRGGARLP